ncbi:MAG: DUF4465 domain-containing protein [Chthoniobacterales bacterium]|nr:DUF4465 domain-containing protein [Chthoniobacterales bacterium]
MKKLAVISLAASGILLLASLPAPALIVDFTDLSLSAESFQNNAPFTSHGAGFNNSYDINWGSWGGFSYSNTTDTTTPGYLNQYSSITGTNANGVAGGIYAVAYQDFYTPTTPTITLPLGYTEPVSLTLTNTTYTYLAIRDGDGFANAFDAGDWFKVTITGYSSGNVSQGSLDFYLADYRSANPSERYIVNTWTEVNLTSFGSSVSYLTLEFDSSDTGIYGINTPTYAAVGKLNVVPEPSAAWLVLLGGVFVGGGLVVRSRQARRRDTEVSHRAGKP